MKKILSLETTTQLAVFLENRPGALARVCEALAKAGINIHALTVSDTVDHAVIRMIVSDPTKALMLLGERGVLAFENDVLFIEATNERGVLARIADALSRVEVNIEYAYFASGATAAKEIIVLRPADVEQITRETNELDRNQPKVRIVGEKNGGPCSNAYRAQNVEHEDTRQEQREVKPLVSFYTLVQAVPDLTAAVELTRMN